MVFMRLIKSMSLISLQIGIWRLVIIMWPFLLFKSAGKKAPKRHNTWQKFNVVLSKLKAIDMKRLNMQLCVFTIIIKTDLFLIVQNGATCVDGINDYICKCAGDYSGKFCEITPSVAMLYPQTSPCQHHDCVHGVCFQPSGANDYLCKCAPGYSGQFYFFYIIIYFN